jgi:hypothetical protein
MMLPSVEGIYRNGRIELTELPDNVTEETRVIVTFIGSNIEAKGIDLRSRGISQAEAEVLRSNFATFAEDWNHPDMDIYDDYNSANILSRDWLITDSSDR